MSEQLHHCDPARAAKERKLSIFYAAIAIALAVGFGYSMASIKYQDTLAAMDATHQEVLADVTLIASKERASLHNRYMRQLGKKDKEISALVGVCRIGVNVK
jgi:hypothetical protein